MLKESIVNDQVSTMIDSDHVLRLLWLERKSVVDFLYGIHIKFI